jgi:hypothetical protein
MNPSPRHDGHDKFTCLREWDGQVATEAAPTSFILLGVPEKEAQML